MRGDGAKPRSGRTGPRRPPEEWGLGLVGGPGYVRDRASRGSGRGSGPMPEMTFDPFTGKEVEAPRGESKMPGIPPPPQLSRKTSDEASKKYPQETHPRFKPPIRIDTKAARRKLAAARAADPVIGPSLIPGTYYIPPPPPPSTTPQGRPTEGGGERKSDEDTGERKN